MTETDELVSVAAHALKTPLAVIAGYSELLQARDDPAVREEGLAHISEAAQQLLRVTDDVLALVSLDAPSFPEPVALGELMEEAVQRFEERAGRPLAAAPDNPWLVVFADREHVLALVAALGGSFPGDGEAATIALREDGHTALLTLSCSSVAPARDTNYFARYVARRLAEASGGALSIEGAVATVKLPLAGVPPGALRLLLVDDDDAVRSLLRMTLPLGEFVVVEAADGEAALAELERERPDIVLLDWKLPGRSGGEVLAALRREHPGLPVIVLTADVTAKTREEATALGADTFLTKPFSPRELLGVVERLVPGRRR